MSTHKFTALEYAKNIHVESFSPRELVPLFQELLYRTQNPNPHIAHAAEKILDWIENQDSFRGTDESRFMKIVQATTDEQQLWAAFGDWWFWGDTIYFLDENHNLVFEILINNPHLLHIRVNGRTFLSRVVANGMADRAQMLLDAGANPYLESETPPINRDTFEYFIQYRDQIKRRVSPANMEKLRLVLLAADTNGLYQDQL